jgi:hypothetical protein
MGMARQHQLFVQSLDLVNWGVVTVEAAGEFEDVVADGGATASNPPSPSTADNSEPRPFDWTISPSASSRKAGETFLLAAQRPRPGWPLLRGCSQGKPRTRHEALGVLGRAGKWGASVSARAR